MAHVQPTVAVSGGAVTGCFAAMIAHSKGFDVDLYEKRSVPTRQIQWSVRQAFLDALAKVDPEGAEILFQAIGDLNNPLASEIPRGSIKTISINGQCFLPTQKARPRPVKPDPGRDCKGFLSQKPCFIVKSDNLEKFLHQRLQVLNGRQNTINIIHENASVVDDPEHNCVFVNNKAYPVALCAEGANSKTFRAMREDHPNMSRSVFSPERIQIAAVVTQWLDREQSVGGYTLKGYDMRTGEDGSDGICLSGITVAENVSGKIEAWVVQDLILDPKSAEERSWEKEILGMARSSNVNHLSDEAANYLTRYILNTAIAQGTIDSVSESPVNTYLSTLSGQPIHNRDGQSQNTIRDFILRHELINNAAPSARVLFMGDSVGNAHWSVGGGMQIGAIGHGERLHAFLDRLQDQSLGPENIAAYSEGVIEDSRSWLVSGYADTCLDSRLYLEDFKNRPEHPVQKATQHHEQAIKTGDPESYAAQERRRGATLRQAETSLETSLVPVSKQVYLGMLRSWLWSGEGDTNLAHDLENLDQFLTPDKHALKSSLQSLLSWASEETAYEERLERERFAACYLEQLHKRADWPAVHLHSALLTSLPGNLCVSEVSIKSCPKLTSIGSGFRIIAPDDASETDALSASNLVVDVRCGTPILNPHLDGVVLDYSAEGNIYNPPQIMRPRESSDSESDDISKDRVELLLLGEKDAIYTQLLDNGCLSWVLKEKIWQSVSNIFAWIESADTLTERAAREQFSQNYFHYLVNSKGDLNTPFDIQGMTISEIPDNLLCKFIDVRNCQYLTHLPENHQFSVVVMKDCHSFRCLGNSATLERLYIEDCDRFDTWGHNPNLSQDLVITDCASVTHLPDGMMINRIRIENCPQFQNMGNSIRSNDVSFINCPLLSTIPESVTIGGLSTDNSTIMDSHKPAIKDQFGKLFLSDLKNLVSLSDHLSVYSLEIHDCPKLEDLGSRTSMDSLELNGCPRLVSVPITAIRRIKHLTLENFGAKDTLPLNLLPLLGPLRSLTLDDIDSLTDLPDNMAIEELSISRCINLGKLGDSLKLHRLSIEGETLIQCIPQSTEFMQKDYWHDAFPAVSDLVNNSETISRKGSYEDDLFMDIEVAPGRSIVLSNMPKPLKIPAHLTFDWIEINGCEDVEFL